MFVFVCLFDGMCLGVENNDNNVCVHQSHGSTRSAGALARPLDGQIAATASADHLRDQFQVLGGTSTASNYSVCL